MEQKFAPYVSRCLLKKLVVFKRCNHVERRNIDFEQLARVNVFHHVRTVHAANFGMQVAAAHILVLVAGINNGLHAHYTFALYLAVAAV